MSLIFIAFSTRIAGQSINEHSFNSFLLTKLNLFTHIYIYIYIYIYIHIPLTRSAEGKEHLPSAEGKEHLPSIAVDSTVSIHGGIEQDLHTNFLLYQKQRKRVCYRQCILFPHIWKSSIQYTQGREDNQRSFSVLFRCR